MADRFRLNQRVELKDGGKIGTIMYVENTRRGVDECTVYGVRVDDKIRRIQAEDIKLIEVESEE